MGGDIPALVDSLRQAEARLRAVERDLPPREEPDQASLRAAMTTQLGEWKAVLSAHAPQAKDILRSLIEPILVDPAMAFGRGRARLHGPAGQEWEGELGARRLHRLDRSRSAGILSKWATTQNGVPSGSRTRVAAVKGRCPRPLDDGDLHRSVEARACCQGWAAGVRTTRQV
jgi:hypothetical protein